MLGRALVTELTRRSPLFIHAHARGARTRTGARKSSKERKKAAVCSARARDDWEQLGSVCRFVCHGASRLPCERSGKCVCVPPDMRARARIGEFASTSRVSFLIRADPNYMQKSLSQNIRIILILFDFPNTKSFFLNHIFFFYNLCNYRTNRNGFLFF